MNMEGTDIMRKAYKAKAMLSFYAISNHNYTLTLTIALVIALTGCVSVSLAA